MDELVSEFVAESLEGLERMELCVTELESSPADRELIADIFRAVHTIKGATGFLGFDRLQALAHAGENLLSTLRAGRLHVTTEIISGLLALHDGLRSVLRLIETTGCEGQRATDEDYELISRLMAFAMNDVPLPSFEPAANEQHTASHREHLASLEQQLHAADDAESRITSETRGSTVRVHTEVLNRLMNLVGELVVTRNGILQGTGSGQPSLDLTQRLDSITSELRCVVMQARMQPVTQVFRKFPRMVRDLALACGRQVRLEFDAAGTELDKTMLEAIRDPLTHAIRNAVDHGIEPPEERIRQGKTPEGLIRLRAYGHSGGVVIEVFDDGTGISPDRVLERAIAQGLLNAERASQLSNEQIIKLLFEPGFSTATAVTSISGRGVGLDIVRANIEKVGGSVEIESQPGASTLLRLRIPLTLAIVPALVVRSGEQRFAIPQNRLLQLAYIAPGEISQSIERIGSAELLRLRNQLLPIVRLNRILGFTEQPSVTEAGIHLALVEDDEHRYALAVDELLAPEEIVVKPLSPLLRQSGIFSGAGTLAGGQLALILDLRGIGERAGIRPQSGEKTLFELHEPIAAAEHPGEAFLIYEIARRTPIDSTYDRMALPLSAIEHILRIERSSIQSAGGRFLLPHGGKLLPVEDTGALLATSCDYLTILIRRAPAARAIVVGRVVDISHIPAAATNPVESVALVQNKVTLLHSSDSGVSPSLEEVA